ncbi:MAG: hypothetical protein D6737_05310 [Chloroflexi bacterium]|nr:MAG: hypothetical protein D6737_05310 [Chloroflexota bacterium]
MQIRRMMGVLIVMMMLVTGTTQAQRGRGGGGGGIQIPQVNPPTVNIPDSVPSTSGETIVGQVEAFANTLNGEDLSAVLNTLQLPQDLPATADELEAYLGQYSLPYDYSVENFDDFTFGTSQEAYGAVIAFAQQHLGISPAPIYAWEISGESQAIDTSDPSVQQIVSQLPPESQALVESAATISTTSYWGLMADGAAVVYVDAECESGSCAIDLDTLQFSISTASLGGYGFYRLGNVGSESDALSMIVSTFPTLANIPLTGIPVEAGYAFAGTAVDNSSATLLGYVAGVDLSVGQPLVYALVGVGEGYLNVVR